MAGFFIMSFQRGKPERIEIKKGINARYKGFPGHTYVGISGNEGHPFPG